MRVYVDLFFLVNAAADLALLAVAGHLAGRRLRLWRLLAGSAFGGLYGLAALLVALPAAFSPIGAAAAAALMILIAFAPVPARVLLRLLAFFYGAAALLAGLTLLLSLGAGGGGLSAGIPWWAFALALGACLVGGALAWDRWRPEARARWLCDLEITLHTRRVLCRALVDSGNTLRDPWGDGPAVLVDAAVLRGLLPDPLLACMSGGPADIPAVLAQVAEVAAAAEAPAAAGLPSPARRPTGGPPAARPAGPSPDTWAGRLRVIPFHSVGGSGVLYGVRPDAVRVRTGPRWVRVRAVVGVSPAPLDPEAGYRALVPACAVAAAPEPPPRDADEGSGLDRAAAIDL